jgi:hypothetical protein
MGADMLLSLQRRNAAYQGHEAAFNRDSARRRSLQLQDMSPSPSSQSISQDQGHPEQPEAPDQIYPYRTWGQPERVYLGAFICLLLLIFGGWWVWLNPRRLAEEIISNYLAHVFFLFLYAGIRIHRRNQLGSRIFGFVPAKGLLLNVDTRFVAAEREDEKAESWWLKVPRVVFHWVFW